MTWEQFTATGAVEDYLSYKGIDWKEQQRAVLGEMKEAAFRKEAEHGTTDNGNGHGAGRLSIW